MFLKLCISAGLAFLTALSPSPPAPADAPGFVQGSASAILDQGSMPRASGEPKAYPMAPQQADSRGRIQTAPQAAAAEWSAPLALSRSAFRSTAPTISLDVKGHAFVAWTEWTGAGMGRNMMFATNAGGAWAPAAVVAPLEYDAIDDVGFPTVAAAPGGTAWVAYHDGDFSLNHMVIRGARYANGALGRVANISGTPGATSYVALGVSPMDESLHAAWMDNTVREWDIVTRYWDGITGQWSNPDILPVQPNVSKATYQVEHIAFDAKGTAHMAYQTRYNKAQVWYTQNRTPKNINTWSEPFNVAPNTLLSDVLPRIQADADGDAYVVWHEIFDGNEEVLFRRTVSGVWQPTENISKTASSSENPSIAVNPETKEIFIVWQEQMSDSNWDVFMNSCLLQKGTTTKVWTGPVNMTKSSGRSLDPNIAVMPDGALSLVYQEEIPGAGGRSAILFAAKAKTKPDLQVLLPPVMKTSLNRVLFYSKKSNAVTFARNEANDDALLMEYRIYRRKAEESDTQLVLLATLDLATFSYKDSNLITKQKYAYAVGVVDKDGQEKRSDTVVEK